MIKNKLLSLMTISSVLPMQAYFKSRGYVPGGIITNSKNEFLHMEQLPAFLRTLLVADGTVTKSLEAYFWEQVDVENLGQEPIALDHDVPWLELHTGDTALSRRVRLRGLESTRIYVHAQSLIKLAALPQPMRADLAQGRIGIGELLRECGLETYREILDVGFADTSSFAGIFDTEPDQLIYRTYRILVHHQPAIQITETFPCGLYR